MRFSPYGGTCPRIVDFLRLGIISDEIQRKEGTNYEDFACICNSLSLYGAVCQFGKLVPRQSVGWSDRLPSPFLYYVLFYLVCAHEEGGVTMFLSAQDSMLVDAILNCGLLTMGFLVVLFGVWAELHEEQE